MDLWRDPAYTAFWLDLARSDLAVWLQLTPYVYAALEGIHLVGVASFFGPTCACWVSRQSYRWERPDGFCSAFARPASC